jgi:ABC-2 type transport system permease protein
MYYSKRGETLTQISILLGGGFAFMLADIMPDFNLNAGTAVVSLGLLLATIVGLVSIGLTIGSQMERPEGFQLIGSFVIFPMFFLSGSLFPIINLPSWLAPFIFISPVIYAVDGIRGTLIGISKFHPVFDFLIVGIFSLVMILLGTYASKKMKL